MKKIIIVAFIAFLVILSLWQISKSLTFQFAGEIISNVRTSDSLIALTLDNGPFPKYTEEVLAILDNYNVVATFFLNGRDIEKHIEQAQKIVQAGHELGNHSYSHESLVLKSPGFIRDEIRRTDEAIRRAGYTGEIYFRPPFGEKLFVLPWLLSRENRVTVTWNIYPESYDDVGKDAQNIANHIIEKVKPGSIILLHVMTKRKEECRKSLPIFIEKIKAQGYKFVTVSELINPKN